MPEGDTIFRLARRLHHALAGQTVRRFESVLPALSRVDDDRPLAGRAIESVAARGKHLLMTFSGDLTLHSHLRMNGSWQLYEHGEPWRRSRRDMRVIVETDRTVAVGFNLTIAEFLTARALARHPQLQALGPDLLDPAFDSRDALRRLRAGGGAAVGDALLDQRIIAGIGNVLKSEILFVAGIHPFAAVSRLDAGDLERLITVALKLLAMNVPADTPGGGWPGPARRTRNSLDPSASLWVYGRGGRPCRRCGAAIAQRKSGADARVTFWCPRCQPDSITAAPPPAG